MSCKRVSSGRPAAIDPHMAWTDAFVDLPDDVLANIIDHAVCDTRGFAESSKRLLGAVRAACRGLHLSGEDGLAFSRVPRDRAFTDIRTLRYDLTCSSLTAPAATAALLAAAERHPGLSHVSLVCHEAPEEADQHLKVAWRSSIQGIVPLVEQLLVLQRCRSLVSLDLTFTGQMVAAMMPLRSLTALTRLRLAGLPRESISNHIYKADLTRINALPLRDLALDCVHVMDMDAAGEGDVPCPYPPTLTRLELSRSRHTGEHMRVLAACPELCTLDICYGTGMQYPATDRVHLMINDATSSCLQQLSALHVWRDNPQELVNFSTAGAGEEMRGMCSFIPDEVTALTSLTRLSAKDWSYLVLASDWQNLGMLPQLQVFSGALCHTWPPLRVVMPAVQQLACRVAYRPPTPDLLLPLLLRALPDLRQLEAALEDPPQPPLDEMGDVEDPSFNQLDPERQVEVWNRLVRERVGQLRLDPETAELAEEFNDQLFLVIMAEQDQLPMVTRLYQNVNNVLLLRVLQSLAERPAAAQHLTRLVLKCCCSPSRAPRMVRSCRPLPELVPALQQLELSFPLQVELVLGLLEVVARLTQLTSLTLTAEAWAPAPSSSQPPVAGAAAGGAPGGAVGAVGAEGGGLAADAGNAGEGGAAAAAAAPHQAAAAAEVVTSFMFSWHPLLQQYEKEQATPAPLPPVAAGLAVGPNGGCVVRAGALAAAVVPLQQLQVLSIQGFGVVCPEDLGECLLLRMPRLSRLRHCGCAVGDGRTSVSNGPAVLLLEAIVL